MSGSTPADLAVAFRSFGRRLREAIGDSPADPQGPAGELQRLVDRVAASLHAPGSDVASEGAAIARAIESRPADQWTNDELTQLRADALEAGRLLRLVEARHDTGE
jgi:hypothetical protein